MSQNNNFFKEDINKDLIWYHFDLNDQNLGKLLKESYNDIDNISKNILLADETRPKITKIVNGYIIILRGINLNKNSDPEDMVGVRILVTENNIYSFSKRKLKAIDDLREKISSKNIIKNSEEFISIFINLILKKIQPFINNLSDQIDQIEEEIIDENIAQNRQKILNFRKQIITIKRYLSPQKEVLNFLKNDYFKIAKNKKYLSQNIDHITRFIEDLDLYREKLQIIKDEISNIISEKLNKNTYITSIVATLFLPIGFLTGLLGVNLGGIPGQDKSSFWVFTLILVILFILELLFLIKLSKSKK